jgi:membrane protease YdiL (CAAX protease family)
MRLNFDDRLEKSLFYFVICYGLFWCFLDIVDISGTDAGIVEIMSSQAHLFCTIIPLIIAYKLPWSKEVKLPRKDAKIGQIYLGILAAWFIYAWAVLMWHLFPEMNWIYVAFSPWVGPLVTKGVNPPHTYSINPWIALYRLSTPIILIAFFLILRKQSLKTVGVSLDNLKRSMIPLIIPSIYVLVCMYLSDISLHSIGMIVLANLVVGTSEELLYRGFPLFRFEPLGRGVAVLVTGIFFAGVHIINGWFAPLMLIIEGLRWGLTLLKTRNILPLIFLHAFMNIVSDLVLVV